MKHYFYLGVNNNHCHILSSIANFDMLMAANEIEREDFKDRGATNWNGRDSIERTLKLRNYILTGRKIILNKPFTINGVDDDMGNSYSWNFKVKEIWEIKS